MIGVKNLDTLRVVDLFVCLFAVGLLVLTTCSHCELHSHVVMIMTVATDSNPNIPLDGIICEIHS